ncbi:MAG: hypothetical protein WKF71_04085 [Pyrinomonadaceae bacterium]
MRLFLEFQQFQFFEIKSNRPKIIVVADDRDVFAASTHGNQTI